MHLQAGLFTQLELISSKRSVLRMIFVMFKTVGAQRMLKYMSTTQLKQGKKHLKGDEYQLKLNSRVVLIHSGTGMVWRSSRYWCLGGSGDFSYKKQ